MNRLGAGDGQGEHCVDCGRLEHWPEGLIVVDTESLGEATKDPMNLVPFQRAVRVELLLENPFTLYHFKESGVVGDEGSKFFFHGAAPVWIDKAGTDGGGHRQQGRHRIGRQGESVSQ
jgi:hypothetical protein